MTLKQVSMVLLKLMKTIEFKIEIPFFYDSHVFFIQNRNNKNRIENLGFTLDTFPVPAISYRNNELPYVSYKAGLSESS